jgi:hypothetical protein
VYINGKVKIINYWKVKELDIIQIFFYYIIFFNLFKKKIFKFKNFKGFFLFYFKNNFLKLKYPFYIEKNKIINTCILLFKPEPFFNVFKVGSINFNFFFYKYLFYFMKKKTF